MFFDRFRVVHVELAKLLRHWVDNRSECPVSRFLDLFGDKWSLLVLRDLVTHDKTRFKQFLESDEKIATNILPDRLKKLEAQGLRIKSKDPDEARQFVYAPALKAQDLVPVLKSFEDWSAKYSR